MGLDHLVLTKPIKLLHIAKVFMKLAVDTVNCNIFELKLLLTVEDVRLRLFSESDPISKFETQLLVLPHKRSQRTLWSEPKSPNELFLKQDYVPPQTSAILIGVLDEMPFKVSSVISIAGVVVYKKKDSHLNIQNTMDSDVQFSVDELVAGDLETFSEQKSLGSNISDSDEDEKNFFSVIVSSTCYQLKVGASLRIPTTLNLSEIGLKQLWGPSTASGPNFWAGSSPGSLKGLVVACIPLSCFQYRLDVYAKDVKQVLLLAHRLSGFLVQEWKPDGTTGLSDCAHSLSEELRLLLSAAQFPTPEFTTEAWDTFTKNLAALELKTDIDFHLYKPAS